MAANSTKNTKKMKKEKKKKELVVIPFPMSDIKLDPSNVRTHSQKNLDAIAASLKRFGQQKPIVVDSNQIVRAGNGTYEAAKALGWHKISVVVSDLPASELTAYAIADNRTAELADWDDEALAAQLKSMDADLAKIAFDDFELPTLPGDIDIDNTNKELDLDCFDNFDHTCPKCGFEWNKKE